MTQHPSDPLLSRRESLRLAAVACCALAFDQGKPRPPEKARPRKNDVLVYAGGDRAGEPVDPSAVRAAAGPLWAFPRDPKSGIVRDGSRLNRVVLLALDPEELVGRTAEGAVDGIVAYSSVCTHTGCDISERKEQTGHLVCPCHGSEFDPADRARVQGGPAPRPLAQLPLALREGALVVRRGFTGRVGFSTT